MSVNAAQETYNFDPDALRDKYRAERDKRIRADGNDQYVEVTGDYSHYVDDPYVAPGYERDPIEEEIEVVVIGGGFGGMLAAARLIEAGITDIKIVEKGGGFGGTWYWNRYPGASCDIEAYVYLPMLEETGFELIKISRLVGVYSSLGRDPRFHAVTVAIAVKVDAASTKIQDADEILEVKPFAMADIPLDNLSHDHTQILRDYFDGKTVVA